MVNDTWDLQFGRMFENVFGKVIEILPVDGITLAVVKEIYTCVLVLPLLSAPVGTVAIDVDVKAPIKRLSLVVVKVCLTL